MRASDTTSSSREGVAGRLLWRLETPVGLIAMFAVALIMRLLIAPHVGFTGDLRLFQQWTNRLAAVGTHHFYAEGQFADYPPGYLYVLWLTGKLSATPSYLLLKLPPILADLGLAWVAGTFAARLAPASLKQRWPVRALVIAGVLFNPAVLAIGPVWGQVDSVPAFLVVTSLLLLYTGRPGLRSELPALLLFAVAVAMKPQSGFVLPVMLYALYRRYLHHRTRAEMIDGTLAIALAGILALAVWAVSGLAFGLGPVSLLHFYSKSAAVYPVTSANAFNLWGIIGFWRHDSAGTDLVSLAGISAAHLGMLLFVALTVFVLWRTHRAIEAGTNEALALTVASASVALVAFVVLTRMHERYLFISLALLAPLAFIRPLRWAYAGLSALFVLNLWYVYAYFNSEWKSAGYPVDDFHWNPPFNWFFGQMLANDTWQKKVWSVAVTAIVGLVVWHGTRWAAAAGVRLQPDSGLQPVVAGTQDVRVQPEARVSQLSSLTARVASAPPTPASRRGPLILVALSCAFCLFVLRGELTPAPNLNDSAFHLQMVRWADGQIGEGRVPLDGWYPYLSLGSSQFHHYQSLPHTLTASTAHLTGVGDQTTYLWFLYLLLALWPIAVFWGGRLLGWGRWTSAAAAAVSPLVVSAPGYGYEHGSYTWQGYGVYSQLWAMWLLPVAWGLTWRSVTRGTYYAAAALALALTMATHFITGYLAVLTLGIWVLAGGPGYLRRAGRAALLAVSSVLVAAWVLVPLIRDTKWTTQSAYYKGTFFNDSFGAHKVLGWLFRGDLFDAHRFPVVTLLLAVGIVVCASMARRDFRARALLGTFALSLLVFFGRPTLGPVLDLLPGFGDVQIHRFIIGVHLAGILLAGVGLSWLTRQALALSRRFTPSRRALFAGAAAVIIAIAVLAPAWTERAHYDRHGLALIRTQRAADSTDGRDLDRLVAIVKARGDGRVYSGLRGNWGKDYTIGYVPVHAWYADRMVDAIGFTFRTIASLSTDPEVAFDETNPAQYEMHNVKYLILPADRAPSVPAKPLASSGRHRLWEVATTGYLQVVDRAPAVKANRTNLERATLAFRQSDEASRAIYPSVTFPGTKTAPPTFVGTAPLPGVPGSVLSQTATPQDGVFGGTVEATRPAVVLLKASYDPRWTATVDGVSVKPVMMAPSLVGVGVPAGRHIVRFRYDPVDHYALLLSLGALTLLALALYPRYARVRARATTARGGKSGTESKFSSSPTT